MNMPSRVPTVTRQRDLRAEGYTSKSITAAVERGALGVSAGECRVTAAGDRITEKHTYVQVAKWVPQGVFCLVSALAFHELTVQNTWKMEVALPRPAHEPKVDFDRWSTCICPASHMGPTSKNRSVEGVTVKVYSPGVADLFKFRNRYGVDLALEAPREV